MAQIRIGVDPDNVFGRQLTELEQSQLPYTLHRRPPTRWPTDRERWKRQAPRVFDRPTPLTVNAAMYRKATRPSRTPKSTSETRPSKAPPAAKYLLAGWMAVSAAGRASSGCCRPGLLSPTQFAVMGRGAQANQYGNVPAGQVTKILSQLAQRDRYQNETSVSRKRRRGKGNNRDGEYFVITKRRGVLRPGIYERIGRGSGVRSIFIFTNTAAYTPRYDIFGMAEDT